MAEPFLGEVRLFSFGIVPRGWAMCNGQLLSINQYQALFSLLGTTYGGNGQTTFALPNLQGSVPIAQGNGIGLGQAGGEAAHTLITNEMPLHSHLASGSSQPANQASPVGNDWASFAANAYTTAPNGVMGPSAITSAGGSQPHPNMQPYLTVNYCMSLQGIFPNRG